jgi:uncharacterized protein (TIGR04255 family)
MATPSYGCDVLCDVSMPRVLALPFANHEEFPNPPVKAMLGQVRFPAILKIAQSGELGGFQDEIRAEYPEYSQEQQISMALGPEGMSATEQVQNHRFATSDGSWSVVLNQTFLTLEASVATKYSNYDDFRDRFATVWQTALQHLGPLRATQQGLRYVDVLDWDDVVAGEWSEYVQQNLLGLLGVPELSQHVQHDLTDSRLQLTDEVFIALKYGLVRSGPESALGFMFDVDCLSQAPHEDIDVEAITSRFDAFHEEIHVLFHWAMKPKAKERFRAGRDGD